MVEDKTNKIYTELLNHMKDLYPNLNGGQTFSEKSKLPYMHFVFLDAPTRLTTLSNTEDGVNLAFQIDIYSDSGMNMARKMSTSIRDYMVSEGFRCRTFRPIVQPTNISRFVGRYERLDV